MLRQLTCALLLGYYSPARCTDLDSYILKHGHMSCPNEADVASIASARSDAELKLLLVKSIYAGACTAASMPMTKIVSLVKKETSNGGTYYCFNTVDLGVVNDKIECAPSFFVTSLRQELTQRSGDFEIQGEGPFAVRARCLDGGTVFLSKRDGVWWRTAQVIPDEVPEVKVAWSSIDQAIRAGCRGDDVR